MITWWGGLVDGMRDASGQMYMRNRYYDPATGQFTQPDPIGLVGGLNSYGFAAGDPVSYSDPFGLCPQELVRDEKCPGGMTHDEYDRLERLISGSLTPAGSAPLLEMLRSGGIVADQAMVGDETRTQTVWNAREDVASFIRIGPDFWSEGDAAAAFMIAHEYGHVIQRDLRRLIYDNPETAMSNALWNDITGGPGRRTDIGLIFFGATQDDANRYACSVTTQTSAYHDTYCPP